MVRRVHVFRTLQEALQLIGPERRRNFGFVGLLAVLVSALEVIAALMVFVLMQLILEPGQAPDVPVVGDLTRFLPRSSFEELTLWFSAVFGIFMIIRSVAFLVQQYALGRVAEHAGLVLADRLFQGYLSMPYQFHLRRNSAELIRNSYDNVGQVVGSVFNPLATLFAEVVLVVAMLAALLVASPSATATAAVFMLLTVAVTFAVVQPRLTQLGRLRQDAASSALQHLQQGLGGLRDVKILGREETFAASFRDARADMARAEYLRGMFAYVPRVSIETAFIALVLGAIVIAATRGQLDDVLATVGIFAYAGLRIQPSLQKISISLNNLRYAEAAVADLRQDLEQLDASVQERLAATGSSQPELTFDHAIRFVDVNFRYSGANSETLSDINLLIPKGSSVGICGSTGSGKTTLVDLLCGLLEPTQGVVMVDGHALIDNPRSWHRRLGVVHQSSFLVDDTLARNIAFGVPQDKIDHQALLVALEVACLEELVAGLPDGLDTAVGERGVRLSGGQRQRIALARAVYRRPDLVVLDEGTSALDNTTESSVVSRLARLDPGVTLVMVAHRLSTIRRCDQIIFLEAGRISGVGAYESLLETSPAFRAMAT